MQAGRGEGGAVCGLSGLDGGRKRRIGRAAVREDSRGKQSALVSAILVNRQQGGGVP